MLSHTKRSLTISFEDTYQVLQAAESPPPAGQIDLRRNRSLKLSLVHLTNRSCCLLEDARSRSGVHTWRKLKRARGQQHIHVSIEKKVLCAPRTVVVS